MKNIQAADIIEMASKSDFNKLRKKQIQECIRAFNIEQRHIVELKKAFTACSLNENNETPIKDLLESIQEKGLKYPPLILNFFLNVLNSEDIFANSESPKEFAEGISSCNKFTGQEMLSYNKFISLEWIFNTCPMLTSYFYNNSDNFKNAISMNGFVDTITPAKPSKYQLLYQPKLIMESFSP